MMCTNSQHAHVWLTKMHEQELATTLISHRTTIRGCGIEVVCET